MSTWIEKWNPEDQGFWKNTGRRIAFRNLIFSVYAEFLAFSVWQVFSVVVALMATMRFGFSVNQLFWLAALPGLAGATLRIPYSFAVPIFGGRNWTLISTALLLLPAAGLGFAVQNPGTPYPVFLLLAILAGLGGGNFASSMANISYFFPNRQKGLALGINAAGGNLGVSVVQMLVPLAISFSIFGALGSSQASGNNESREQIWLQNAGFIWVPLILIALVTTWFFMNNLHVARASLAEQAIVLRRKHTWLISWLYLGTFGSFIGYSAGLPLLIQTQFPGVNALQYAFLGPLVGSLARPFGGWLADRLGGARVTFWNFLAMVFLVLSVLFFLGTKDEPGGFTGFLIAFLGLFITTGIGNGSTFRMVPVIFRTQCEREAEGDDEYSRDRATRNGLKEAAAALGISSAMGAYGGFFIPKGYGTSIAVTGGPQASLYCFAAFYVTCLILTWWYYHRRDAEIEC